MRPAQDDGSSTRVLVRLTAGLLVGMITTVKLVSATSFSESGRQQEAAKAAQLKAIGKVNEDNPIHRLRRTYGADELED